MTDEERRILATGQCLTDTHMQIAAQILKKQFPEQEGLQDTIFIAESRAKVARPWVSSNPPQWLKPLGGKTRKLDIATNTTTLLIKKAFQIHCQLINRGD